MPQAEQHVYPILKQLAGSCCACHTWQTNRDTLLGISNAQGGRCKPANLVARYAAALHMCCTVWRTAGTTHSHADQPNERMLHFCGTPHSHVNMCGRSECLDCHPALARRCSVLIECIAANLHNTYQMMVTCAHDILAFERVRPLLPCVLNMPQTLVVG
jgi:hypothetical protein